MSAPLRSARAAAAPADSLPQPSALENTLGLDFSSFTSTRSLVTLGLGAGLAAWAWEETDENFPPLKEALDKSFLDPFLDFGNLYGSGLVVGGGSAALIGLGRATGNEGMATTGTDLARAFVHSAALCWVLKVSVNRTRPSGGPYSFPSGHTTSAFSTVAPVWHHAGWGPGLGATVAATLAGIGRMEENRHYLSDVIAGAVLGLVTGWAVIDHRRELELLDHVVVGGDVIGLAWRF
ncbi:phosphatase PAP2 family protein [bacterium]|nr:phosphatase PAP2 family protein [bacterium]